MSVSPRVLDAELKFCAVEEASEMSPPVYVLSAVQVFGVVVAGKSPATARRAPASEYCVRQLPPIAKQPPVKAMPFRVEVAPVTVRLLPTFKLVEVALVPVADRKLSVVTLPFVAKRFDEVLLVMVPLWMSALVLKRSVLVPAVEVESPIVAFVKSAFVAVRMEAKKLVEVACVEVALPMERNWRVEDAREMSPPVYVLSCVQVLALVVETRRPDTARRARGSVKYRFVFSVRSSVVAPPTTCPAMAFNTPESEVTES